MYSRWQLVVMQYTQATRFSLFLLLHETLSALTPVPLNQVAVIDDHVILHCTVNPSGPLAWKFYPLDGKDCQLFHSASGIDKWCIDETRYNVTPQSNGTFNLNINKTVMSDAGMFSCYDPVSDQGASAVYGVIGSKPNVTSNTSQSCLCEGDQVVLTCHATYNGSNTMPLSMTWTTSSGKLVNSNITNDTATGLFQSKIYITANTSDIPVHRCNVTFNAPTSDAVPLSILSRQIKATNAPTYSSVAASSNYTVQYCPRTIKIALSNGTGFAGGQLKEETVVYCSFEDGSAGITATYTWTNATNGDVLSNSQNVTIPVGNYTFTCTANSSMNCGVGRSKTCGNLNKTVSATAFRPDVNPPHHEFTASLVAVVVGAVVVVVVVVVVIIMVKRGRFREHCYMSVPNQICTEGSANSCHLMPQTTSAGQRAGHQDSSEMSMGQDSPPDVLHTSQSTRQGNYPPYSQQQTSYNPRLHNSTDPQAETTEKDEVLYADLQVPSKPHGRQPIEAQSETVYAPIARA
jgi:hypothetical protein